METPPTKKARTDENSQPPIDPFKLDGISSGSGKHLKRDDLVDRVVQQMKDVSYMVVGSPPSSGKSSLLQLLKWYLRALPEGERPRIVQLKMNKGTASEDYFKQLARAGMVNDMEELCKIEKTWVLVDDAQNAYDPHYYPLWEFLVKIVGDTDEIEGRVKVVIATTYDLDTPTSPVIFKGITHEQPDATQEEIMDLWNLFSERLDCEEWVKYRDTLVDISRIDDGPGTSPRYQIGVVMAGIRLVAVLKKRPGTKLPLVEKDMVAKLRGTDMIEQLKRCFCLPESIRNEAHQMALIDMVIGEVSEEAAEENKDDGTNLEEFYSHGILSGEGSGESRFRSIAAQWFYYKQCFPNRALQNPASLRALVKEAVKAISSRRLADAGMEDGFPKEAAFQHLFNESMARLLRARNPIIPELNTFATDGAGKVVTGELDFYINGSLKWALELLRNGDKISEHLERFDPNVGKYRKVEMNEFLVVDCRPYNRKGAKTIIKDENRCTLLFSENFRKCVCQMGYDTDETLRLAN